MTYALILLSTLRVTTVKIWGSTYLTFPRHKLKDIWSHFTKKEKQLLSNLPKITRQLCVASIILLTQTRKYFAGGDGGGGDWKSICKSPFKHEFVFVKKDLDEGRHYFVRSDQVKAEKAFFSQRNGPFGVGFFSLGTASDGRRRGTALRLWKPHWSPNHTFSTTVST